MSPSKAIRLIAGLGNPGAGYARTRHNAGFWFVDAVADDTAARFRSESRFKANVARVDIAGDDVWLVKPDVFMNESGPSIAACAAYYRIPASEVLVAHDELSLGCGKVQIKRGGGHGGHNGLRDIVSHLSAAFVRLRIGIDHPGPGADVARYVLNVPPADEYDAITRAIDSVRARIEGVVAGNFDLDARARRRTRT